MPETPTSPPPKLPYSVFASIAGVPRSLQADLPAQELGNYAALGMLTCGAACTEFLGFNVIGHELFAEVASPLTVAAIAFPAAIFVSVVDVCVLYRFPIHRLGLRELARGGLHTPRTGGLTSKLATALRIGICLSTGGAVGYFGSMAVYSKDIRIEIDAQYLIDNKPIADSAAALYDAAIKRATNSVDAGGASLRSFDLQVDKLRKEEVRASLQARHRHWAEPAANTQLTVLDQTWSNAISQLGRQKAELSSLIENRNAAIMKAIDTAPNHKPKRDGALGRMTAFGKILRENRLAALVALALEMVVLGLSLGPVLAHAIYVPSTFAAHLALEHLKTVSRMAREGVAHLDLPPPESANRTDNSDDALDGEAGTVAPVGDDASANSETAEKAADPTVPETPKRKRGRPRRVRSNGHDVSLPITQFSKQKD